MHQNLSIAQQHLLRRCDGGLRVWETGARLTDLLADLAVLSRLELVIRDEERGYELTAAGQACIAQLGF